MSQIFQADFAVNAATQAVATTTETVVVISNKINGNVPSGAPALTNPRIHVRGNVVAHLGAGTTALVVRLYRGTTAAGTLIGTITVSPTGDPAVPANAIMNAVIDALDTLPTDGYLQYCLSVQQTSASDNASITLAAITLELLQR